MDRGAWPGIVHGVPKSLTQLNTHMIHRYHTKHYRYTWGRKVWSLFTKTSQSSWRNLLMKGGLEIKPYASFHHPMWKTLAATECSVHGLNSTRSSCGSLIPNARGHKTAHLKTLFVSNFVHDKTSPSPGAVSVTVNLQVTCVGTNLASGLKLQWPLLARRMFPKVVFYIFARNWETRV